MKKKIFAMAVVLAFCTTTSVSAQSITDVLGKVKSALTGTTESSAKGSIEGTWVYSGADIEFTSDNLLAQAGGKLTSDKIESTINSALTKYGIAPNKLSLTFGKDSTYTGAYSNHSTKGSYLYNKGKLTIKPSAYSGKTITTDVSAGKTLTLSCDASKVLTLAQMICNQVATQEHNTTLTMISQLAKNYKGMKVGLKFKKK